MPHEEGLVSQEKSSSSFTVFENHVSDRANAKAKKVLNIDDTSNGCPSRSLCYIAHLELQEIPAFNSSQVLHKARIGPSDIPDKAITIFQEVAESLIQSKSVIKRLAARTVAGNSAKSNQYSNLKAIIDFLEAHDDLKKVDTAGEESREEEVERRRHNVDDSGIVSRNWSIVGRARRLPRLEQGILRGYES
jgi:hypothetical protein